MPQLLLLPLIPMILLFFSNMQHVYYYDALQPAHLIFTLHSIAYFITYNTPEDVLIIA
jgi:hypothetical protein